MIGTHRFFRLFEASMTPSALIDCKRDWLIVPTGFLCTFLWAGHLILFAVNPLDRRRFSNSIISWTSSNPSLAALWRNSLSWTSVTEILFFKKNELINAHHNQNLKPCSYCRDKNDEIQDSTWIPRNNKIKVVGFLLNFVMITK